MIRPPGCSVIIPAYNAEQYINEAIESVLNQTHRALEIIVVDDGSTDGTSERVRQYGDRVKLLRNERSGGSPGAARNIGIENSEGEYLCFLDADDVMLPRRIQLQAQFMSSHPDVAVVFVDYRNFTGSHGPFPETHFQTCAGLTGRLAGADSLALPSEVATGLLLQENFGGAGTAMVRRAALRHDRRFAGEFATSEDFHFFYQLARDHAVGAVNEVGLMRRLHPANITGDKLRVLRNFIATRMSLRESECKRNNRRLLDRCLANAEIQLAREYANHGRFGPAVAHNLHAVVRFLPASLPHASMGLRTLLRTAAIAARLKKPCP